MAGSRSSNASLTTGSPSNPAAPKSYYVDCIAGNDANSGKSPDQPMANLAALLSLYTKEELDGYVARVKAEQPQDAEYVERRTLPDIELCRERGFAVSLGEWRREIFGVAAPLYRTPSGDCLFVNCGIPSFRFSAEQIERECGPRILGLARSITSLVANA